MAEALFAVTFSSYGNVSQAASKQYVKSLKLSKSTVSMKVGKSVKIKVTVTVSGKAKKTVSAKSSNNSVAKVKVGKANKKGVTELTITARKAGNAKITVTTKDKAKNKKAVKKTIRVKIAPVTTKAPTPTKKPAPTEKPAPTKKPATTEKPVPEKPTSVQVKWTVSEETFIGKYAQTNEATGKEEIFSKELTRKYVSFSPWPTTNEQVEYVIKNCDDPYVIGALYVVALDNFEYKGLGNYSGEVYKMLNTLMSGAGTVTGSNYQLSNFAKQKICEFGMKQVTTGDGTVVKVSTFASRAYLKGATPYNNYTPEGGMEDKTKWKIVMDEYVYCGDLENGYITVCPQRYSEEKLEEDSEQTVVEHWQGIRIGCRWNKTAKVWLPTDNISLSKPPTGALVPFNVESQIFFTSNYMVPVPDQGF